MADPVKIPEQLVGAEETPMCKIVRFEARKSDCLVRKMAHQFRIRQQGRATTLELAPCPCVWKMDTRIRVEEPAQICAQDVVALLARKQFDEASPRFGKDLPQAVQEPVD